MGLKAVLANAILWELTALRTGRWFVGACMLTAVSAKRWDVREGMCLLQAYFHAGFSSSTFRVSFSKGSRRHANELPTPRLCHRICDAG